MKSLIVLAGMVTVLGMAHALSAAPLRLAGC
jgi:hypothetical protein